MEYGAFVFAEVVGAPPPETGIWVRVADAWTAIVSAWARVSGSWVEVDVSAKVGGVWELIHEK